MRSPRPAASLTVILACCVAALAPGLRGAAPATAPAPSTAPAGPPIWEKLNLEKVQAGGATLYYEKGLPGDPQRSVADYADFLGSQGRQNEHVREKAEPILAEINRLVGGRVSEKMHQQQLELFSQFLVPMRVDPSTPLCLVSSETLKRYFASGETIPGYTVTDKGVNLNFQTRGKPGEGLPALKLPALVLPVPRDRDIEKMVASVATMFSNVNGNPGIAIHETVEMSIVSRLRPADPHFRWFSDGFANALTARVIGQFVSQSAGRSFLSSFGVSQYAELEEQVNLAWWCGVDDEIETPLESEKRLKNARYAYATFEAQRLLGLHGVELVSSVLDKCSDEQDGQARTSGAKLIEVLSASTGEDIGKRLKRYQQFDTPAEGLERYRAAFAAAREKKEDEAALRNLLRMSELRTGPRDLYDDYTAATLLWKLDHHAEADKVFAKRFQVFERRKASEELMNGLRALWIRFALESGEPAKAKEAADALLKEDERAAPGLALRMAMQAGAGNAAAARSLAEDILAVDTDERSWCHRAARLVLEGKPIVLIK